MNFLGTYYHSIDEKNRVTLPAKIANKFNGILVISKGFDGCLEIRTPEDFSKRVEELMNLSQNHKDTRIIVRGILANSAEVEIDRSNRILVPSNLKIIGALEKEIVLIGVGNKLEMWDTKKYQSFQKEHEDDFESIAEKLDEVPKNKI